jgi:ABC-type molybdate transport system substrate-binding protein
VVLKNAPPAAAAFHDFVAGADGQAIFLRHGFASPES